VAGQEYLIAKREAVAQQIDQAIRLGREGLWASCVTLAGAAESAMPEPEEETVYVWLRRIGAATLQIDATRVANVHLNAARNWLKHSPLDDPMEITPLDAFVMIMRAWSKFLQVFGEDAATETMQSFVAEIADELGTMFRPFFDLARHFTAISGKGHPDGHSNCGP
jgi:hypothetical protein